MALGGLALLWLSDVSVPVHQGRVVAPIVTLRAPADGTLRQASPVAEVPAGAVLAVVEGPAPDPAPRHAADAALALLRAELARVDVASRALADAREGFHLRATAETAARLRIAEARLAEAEAALEAAEGRRREAEVALARAAELTGRGIGTEADLARIRVALDIASQDSDSARLRVRLLEAERDATREGLLPTDPSGRMPEAERAARDLGLRSGRLAAEAAGLRAAIAAREAERDRLAQRRAAETPVTAPVAGRIIERIEPEGAPVLRGAALFRLADCGGAVLSVPVPDALREGLRPGQPVTVRLAGGGALRYGEVMLAEGAAPAVRVDGLAGCALGEAAEIAFGARPFDWLRR